METRYVKEFVVLAETCNFQETAERMYISQSSLTKHIQRIEEELCVPLFDRTTRSVKLNEYGIEFLRHAQRMVNLCHDYENAILAMRNDEDNKLSVGFQARLGQYGIVEMLSDFSKRHPHIALKLTESNRPMELLRSRTCDFIFAAEYIPRDSEIQETAYKVDTLSVVFPVAHPLAKEKQVTIDQLRDEKFVMHEDVPGNTSFETRKFLKLCAENGFEPNTVMTVSFTSNVVRFVEQGMGIAVINRMHAPSNSDINDRIAFVDIYPPVYYKTKFLYYKNYKKTPAAAEFIGYIQEKIARTLDE